MLQEADYSISVDHWKNQGNDINEKGELLKK